MQLPSRDLALVGTLTVLVLFVNLGQPCLWDRDEPRNAGCAREMLDGADWVVPVFNGELRTHKPVFLYWLTMVAYSALGVSEFSARLPSAVCGLGTILLTFAVGQRLFGTTVGRWSAYILTTFMMFGVVGRAATPDSTLLFFATAATAIYVFATWPARSSDTFMIDPDLSFPKSRATALAIYAVLGLAVLAKGPVGLVLPTAVIGMFCLLVRLRGKPNSTEVLSPTVSQRVSNIVEPFYPLHFLRTCSVMRPLLALATVGIIAGPWYVWVGLRTDGAWLRGFLGEHNLGRALQPMEGHGGNVLFYPLAILVACFPWSVFAIPTVLATRQGVKGRRHRDAYLFLTCWVGVYVVLFSIARTKLPSYVAPAFPAIGILIAAYLVEFLGHPTSESQRRWWSIGLLTLAATSTLLAGGMVYAGHVYLPNESSMGIVLLSLAGVIPLCGAAVAGWLTHQYQMAAAARAMLITAAVLSLFVFVFLPGRVSRHQPAPQLIAELGNADVIQLGSFGLLEPSWVYYAGHPIREFHSEQLPAALQFVVEGASDGRGGSGKNAIITTRVRLVELQQAAENRLSVIGRCDYFLKGQELVIVAMKESRLARASGDIQDPKIGHAARASGSERSAWKVVDRWTR